MHTCTRGNVWHALANVPLSSSILGDCESQILPAGTSGTTPDYSKHIHIGPNTQASTVGMGSEAMNKTDSIRTETSSSGVRMLRTTHIAEFRA